MLSDPEGTIDSLHRRHVIAWNNLKKIVIEIANLDSQTFGRVMNSLEQLLRRMDVPHTVSETIQVANQARNQMPPANMQIHAQHLTSALVMIYNAVGNVFVGFGRTNSTLQARNDNGSDMIRLLHEWERKVHKVTILGEEHTCSVKLDVVTLNRYINAFESRTKNLVEAFNALRRAVPIRHRQATPRNQPHPLPPAKRPRYG
ncbi:MAG: hypothetical protein D6711_08790 [Chloroflexi bacterium]|nr:MAG: hypothetical protein D6711_08790 [Chloroflexota bacterium]